jgi:SCP-2 sterol transfer family
MSPTAKRPSGRPDAAAAFFDDLASRGPEPLLHNASGTIRFDLVDGASVEHWFITIERGNIKVSHRNAKADTVMRTEKALFERMSTGTVNAGAAMLRGVVEVEGDLGLMASFDRLLPGPPRSRASFLERQQEMQK